MNNDPRFALNLEEFKILFEIGTGPIACTSMWYENNYTMCEQVIRRGLAKKITNDGIEQITITRAGAIAYDRNIAEFYQQTVSSQ